MVEQQNIHCQPRCTPTINGGSTLPVAVASCTLTPPEHTSSSLQFPLSGSWLLLSIHLSLPSDGCPPGLGWGRLASSSSRLCDGFLLSFSTCAWHIQEVGIQVNRKQLFVCLLSACVKINNGLTYSCRENVEPYRTCFETEKAV